MTHETRGDADRETAPDDLDTIVDAIRAMRSGGKALPAERQLAEYLGIKRHTLRKALAVLRRSGELRSGRPRSSRQLRDDDLVKLANPLEVVELRLMLEPNFARLAALRASAPEIARILDAASTSPAREPGEVDLTFHSAVADGSRNNLGGAFYAMLRKVGTDARIRIAGTQQAAACAAHIERRDRQHRAVAEAIANRDPDAAEAAMREHLLCVQKLIMERSTPDRVQAA